MHKVVLISIIITAIKQLIFTCHAMFTAGNNGPRFCQNNPVTNCWNGMRTVDRDNIDFDNDNITDQGIASACTTLC